MSDNYNMYNDESVNNIMENLDSKKSEIKIEEEISLDTDKSITNSIIEGCTSKNHRKLTEQEVAERIHSIKVMKEENVDIKFGLLIELVKSHEFSQREIVNTVLHLLVNSTFDEEQNFMIYSPKCVIQMLNVIQIVEWSLKAELLSVFIGILRKSKCNLMMTMNTNFIATILEMLDQNEGNHYSAMINDLLIELLGIVASFSVTVKELKLIFQRLKVQSNKCWPTNSIELLNVLQQMAIRSGPDQFFNFPGSQGSGIAIPPISKWPYQNGWTFNCWIHLDPASTVNIDRDKPHLYCFRTNKGLGYSGHFLGSNLIITTMKMKDKGVQHCVKYNFQPRKWYMVSVVYVYNRWTKSEILCYINAELVFHTEMPWQINTNEIFDRCFIGTGPEQKSETVLTGQISSIYGFTESLTQNQIGAIYFLGVSYKGTFKIEAECPQNMLESQRKLAFEGKLCHSLMFAYNPVACDSQLCLNQVQKSNNSMFAHSSHALMTGHIQPVLTQSIYSTLHSLGGVKILFPLFGQLDNYYILPDLSISTKPVTNIGARLINLVFELLYGSLSIRYQLVRSKGILIISHFISCSNLYQQLDLEFLKSLIKLCLTLSRLHLEQISKYENIPIFADKIASIATGPKFLYAQIGNLNTRNIANENSHSLELLKQIYDYLLSNTSMWIQAAPEVQLKLYQFLSNDFLTEGVIFNKTRCVNAILQCLHSIKFYYWLVNPRDRSGIISKIPENAPALNTEQVTIIRSYILKFIRNLMFKYHNFVLLDEEIQGFVNFLTVVNEDDNIRQVLFFLVTLMSELPTKMIVAFDRKNNIRMIFKLLGSQDETVRIMALKIFGFYLQYSTNKSKQDLMAPHTLFSVISERLLLYSPYLTMAMYNTLYEIMVEKLTLTISTNPHSPPDKTQQLKNPGLMKVIAHLIRQSKISRELIQVRKIFLSDLNHLCSHNKENRRTVLQMSVWQDWLLMLAPLSPQTPDQHHMLDSILNLVRKLLHHAIKVEYGGWRVWIDTLAILHSKMSYHEFRCDIRKAYNQYENNRSDKSIDLKFRRPYDTNLTTGISSSTDYRQCIEINERHSQLDHIESKTALSAESVAKMIIEDIFETVCDTVTERSSASQHHTGDQIYSPCPISGSFHLPRFMWSSLHQRLLHDLLCSIENDLQIWNKKNNRNALEFVNSSDNQIYVVNLIHFVTMLSENLISCCGGLLPLLAAATAPGEADILENGNGMKTPSAACFLLRVMNIADIVVFASSLNFIELEQEKNVSNGGILRQCLRLVCTCAVRNCLENRFLNRHYQLFNDNYSIEVQSTDERSKLDGNLPMDQMQEIVNGLRPRCEDTEINDLFKQNYPISDPFVLLQDMDINRLRAVLYRDIDESKQAQYLALTIVYFLSVLMVSKYRDLLETSSDYDSYSVEGSLKKDNIDQDRIKRDKTDFDLKTDIYKNVKKDEQKIYSEEREENILKIIKGKTKNTIEENNNSNIFSDDTGFETYDRKSDVCGKMFINDSFKSEVDNKSAPILNDDNDDGNNEIKVVSIASIQINDQRENSSTQLQNFEGSLSNYPYHYRENQRFKMDMENSEDSFRSNLTSTNLTKRLEQALGGTAQLIRDIFFDFSSFFSRKLIGSHGQELLGPGLITLKQSSSVVEIVMLLCSQEWQNSLQKHAGLAFIELVNEGRILSHASLEHIVRVANEAHFILSRMHAEDVLKHSEFTRLCAIMNQERHDEEKVSERLIGCAKSRDEELANKLRMKIENLVFSNHGIWASEKNEINEFYCLDDWEDDSRRRRRFICDPFGSSHSEAILSVSSSPLNCPSGFKSDVKNELFNLTLEDLNMKSNAITGLSMHDNTLIIDNGYGVTDEELLDVEKFDQKIDEKNESELDLVSEQDLSESYYKVPENKGTTQERRLSDEKSTIDSQKTFNSKFQSKFSNQFQVDITGPVFLSTPAILLSPCVSVHGILSITKSELYFEMDSKNKSNDDLDHKVLRYINQLHGKWHFSEIRAIFSRKYLHKNIGLEIFVAKRTTIMFAFPDQETVRKVVYALPCVGVGIKYCVSQHRESSLASPRQIFKLSNMTQKWQQREISNFDYLMYLNTIAGRTYNDLNQYPIFPWVLANYESNSIDLSSPSNYRDLSSPIGALNPSRKKYFDNRFKNWNDDSQSAFHYGTHYSTAAFVLNYLIRLEPYTTFFLNLQGGKFDHADRIFHSITQTWENCQRNTSDVKELIPEFFYLPEMFTNSNRYKFGQTDDGKTVDDVILPNWAETPEDFVRINKQALESELVSCQLHHWIDLIFGYKQRGPEAIRATNVFCHLTYEGSVDWEQIKDPILKQAVEDQICGFGQTPSQLLIEPHPPRNSALHVSPLMFTPFHTDLVMNLKFISNSPIVWMSSNIHAQSPLPAVLTISANYVYGVNKWNNSAAYSCRRNISSQQSISNSITGALSLAISPSARRSQSNNIQSPLASYPLSNLESNSDSKPHNCVNSNIQLPLSVDPFLAQPSLMFKRSLGDGFDQCMRPHNLQFVTTPDNKVIFAAGFWDKSFRIFSVETGRLLQAVYGHFGVVVCLARSECGFSQDCYLVTGSTDCTVMLWLWGNRQQALLGDFNCRELAQPRITITGYHAEIVCVQISGELGIIASASKDSRCLIHTLQGELMRTLLVFPCHFDSIKLSISREGYILLVAKPSVVLLYTINGKLLGSLSNCDENTKLKTSFDLNDVICKNSKHSAISAITMSKDGDYTILASDDGSIKVRRCHNLEQVYSYPPCEVAITSVTITTDSRFLLAGLCNGTVVVFNIDFNKWHHEYRNRYPLE